MVYIYKVGCCPYWPSCWSFSKKPNNVLPQNNPLPLEPPKIIPEPRKIIKETENITIFIYKV